MALRPRKVASKPTFENWILRPEIAQRLRIFTVLAENQSSVPSIHTGWLATTYITSFKQSDTSDLHRYLYPICTYLSPKHRGKINENRKSKRETQHMLGH